MVSTKVPHGISGRLWDAQSAFVHMSLLGMSARDRLPVQACSRSQEATNASVNGNMFPQLHTGSISTSCQICKYISANPQLFGYAHWRTL